MKRFYILILVSFFVVVVNKIYLARDIKSDISNNTQIANEYETTGDETMSKKAAEEENMTQAEWEKREQNIANKTLFRKKCTKCHAEELTLSRKKTLEGWQETVKRCIKRNPTWILPAEAVTITDYLFKINGLKEEEIEQDKTFQMKKVK